MVNGKHNFVRERYNFVTEEGKFVPGPSTSGINNSDGRTIAEYTLSYSSDEIESGQRQPIFAGVPQLSNAAVEEMTERANLEKYHDTIKT